MRFWCLFFVLFRDRFFVAVFHTFPPCGEITGNVGGSGLQNGSADNVNVEEGSGWMLIGSGSLVTFSLAFSFTGVFGNGDNIGGVGDTPNNSMYLTKRRSSVDGRGDAVFGLISDGPGCGEIHIFAAGGGVNQPGNLSSRKLIVDGDTTSLGVLGLSGVFMKDILATVTYPYQGGLFNISLSLRNSLLWWGIWWEVGVVNWCHFQILYMDFFPLSL